MKTRTIIILLVLVAIPILYHNYRKSDYCTKRNYERNKKEFAEFIDFVREMNLPNWFFIEFEKNGQIRANWPNQKYMVFPSINDSSFQNGLKRADLDIDKIKSIIIELESLNCISLEYGFKSDSTEFIEIGHERYLFGLHSYIISETKRKNKIDENINYHWGGGAFD